MFLKITIVIRFTRDSTYVKNLRRNLTEGNGPEKTINSTKRVKYGEKTKD